MISRIFLVLMFVATSLQGKDKTGEKEFARVAVINFIGKKGKTKLAYLGPTISGNLFTSMKKSLVFKRPTPKKNQRLADKLFKAPSALTKQNLEKYSKKARVDYVIYGTFSQKKKIDINANLYGLSENRIIKTIERKAEANAKLFEDIDNMADDFVKEIVNYVQSQQDEKEDDKPMLGLIKNPFSKKDAKTLQEEAEEHCAKHVRKGFMEFFDKVEKESCIQSYKLTH